MSYFSQIPNIDYKFPDGKILNVKAVFVRPDVDVINDLKVSPSRYIIEDGKSPDSLARDLYEDPQMFYPILMANGIIDYYKDWPTAYESWLNELFLVNSEFTFYTKYKFDILPGDLVCKYISNSYIKFDQNNYGIVTSVNTFHRSFNVKMISGSIEEGQDYIIIRKNSNSYKIIKPIQTIEYQQLIKKIEKLDSVVEFYSQDELSNEFGPVSPYYKSDGSIGDDSVEDLSSTPNVILWKFMIDQLPNTIRTISFKQNKENEWLFNKNIIVIPNIKMGEFLDLLTESINEQKVIFE